MAALADHVGLTRQGLYHHFPNKEAAFVAVIDLVHADSVAEAERRCEAARTDGTDVVDMVTGMLDARFGILVRAVVRSPHEPEILTEVTRRCAHVVAAWAQRFHALFVDALQERIDRGELTLAADIDVETLARALANGARGVNIMYPAPAPDAYPTHYRAMVRLVLFGAAAR